MIDLCCEYLSVRSIWLYVIMMSGTIFRVNPQSIVCLNVKEMLVQSRQDIWSLSDRKEIQTHNYLVRKRTVNDLAKLAKWLSCVVSTYLYGVLECMLLSCHVRVSEWIWNTHSIVCLTINKLLCRSRGNIWSLSDSNKIETHDYLVRKRTQLFSQTDQMIELCCENWTVLWVWLYVIIISQTSFRVNPHSIVCRDIQEIFAPRKR